MEIIWDNEPVAAKDISRIAAEKIGWAANTTYTVINKLVEKGMVKREAPGFMCNSLYSKDEVRKLETSLLADKLFDGSKTALFSALLSDEKLSEKELDELRELIGKR
ncbi:MAG: BlaI/MecI/CopY family transcriptional regulator [Clostridia bacterium]|nr:BlaI/MecI/CopY family transcriptional regulator [Clostridia bacterium]